MSNVSLDPGYYRNIANPLGGWTEQSNWGVTASGLPVVGGLITLGGPCVRPDQPRHRNDGSAGG